MKKLKVFYVFFIALNIVYLSSSCERDDICAEDTPTTPFLIIRFVDNITGVNSKSPNELTVKPVDPEITDSIFFPANLDSIAIPLRTDAVITEYEFILNSDTSDAQNEIVNRDTISFQYTLEEEYLSSACGFRATYLGLTLTPPNEPDDENWIKGITIDRQDIINEESKHISIFH